MKLYLKNCSCVFAIEETAIMLLPELTPRYAPLPPEECFPEGEDYSLSVLEEAAAYTFLHVGGREITARVPYEPSGGKKAQTLAVKTSFYRAALPLLPRKPAWGSLSGVRPAKTCVELASQGKDAMASYLEKTYDLSPEKASLTAEAALFSYTVARNWQEKDACLYIGIPFCPSRCRYCSFITRPGASPSLLESYVAALTGELELLARQYTAMYLRAYYMGGGTPAILSPAQLDRVLSAADQMPLASGCEKTVEMGRPELITREKLDILSSHGIKKLCVNPQSLTPGVLEACGRGHTVEDFLRAYEEVRAHPAGFSVNCDLIALLEGETPESFLSGLQQLIVLGPDTISVHSLAKKRAADLAGVSSRGEGLVADTITRGEALLRSAGYRPYYLYRQKNTADASENVGWCLQGKESLYNIVMMEEIGTVLSAGAGSVTKIFTPEGMLRQSHPKDPALYIERLQANKT